MKWHRKAGAKEKRNGQNYFYINVNLEKETDDCTADTDNKKKETDDLTVLEVYNARNSFQKRTNVLHNFSRRGKEAVKCTYKITKKRIKILEK